MAVVVEFRAIKPAKMNIPGMRDQIIMALRYEGEDVQAEYRKTTESWNHPVRFEILTDLTGNDASVLVGTDDKIFGYVDEGTRPHRIRPRRARYLVFQSGYTAKTKPGQIASWAGGKHGDTVYSLGVSHPGTKARKFSETIQKRRKDKFRKRMIEAIRIGAERLYLGG